MALESGPPVVTVVGVSRSKLGRFPGTDEALVTLAFDRPATGWSLRVNSTSHLDGSPAATGRAPGFGQIPFGTGPFGGSIPSVGTTLAVPATALLPGVNEVVAYATADAAQWSPHPAVAVP